MAPKVKNPPAIQETQVQSLGQESLADSRDKRTVLDCISEPRKWSCDPQQIVLSSWLPCLENLEDFARLLAIKSNLSKVNRK